MRVRTVVSSAVSLAGSIMVAWGIRGTFTAVIPIGGSCGDYGQPSCPPEAGWSAGGIAVGVLLIVVGSALGAGGLWAAVFPAIGVGSLLAAADLPSDQRTFPLVFGIPWVVIGLVPVVLAPMWLARRSRAFKIALNGTRAVGTVLGVEDTGVRVNDNPRLKVRYQIDPLDGTGGFEGQKTMTVSIVDIPVAGQRVPIVFDPADRAAFVVLVRAEEGAPEDIRQFIASVTASQVPRAWSTSTATHVSAGVSDGVSADTADSDPIVRLAMLNGLRLSGALTEEEFQAQKARILGGMPG